jgi:AsmA protein
MALRVAADTSARGELVDVQLNNVGIPLRITGPWTAPRIVPDTSVLTQLLAGQALDRFGNLIGGSNAGGNANVGDAVTGVLSGVIGNRLGAGNNVPPPVNQTPAETTTAPADKKEPETIEDLAKDAAKDAARDALGGLFGRRKKDDD